jgi:hypothetical protein
MHATRPLHAALAVLLALALAAPALADRTRTVRSRHYEIVTDLSRSEVREIGRHMDAVYDAYARMLSSFRVRGPELSRLYLFREKADYHAFMDTQGFNARNTGGVFFANIHGGGLATWYAGRPRTHMWHVLQHEGFHQFAHARIGGSFPIWANEGVAEYFGQSLLIGDRLKTGIVPGHRLEALRRAMDRDLLFPFETIIHMSDRDWSHRLQVGDPRAGLMYDQAWSIVHFLVHADDGRYAAAFESFIRATGEGHQPTRALEMAFGSADLEPFEEAWRAYLLELEPDPISTAVERLEYLGAGLDRLHEEGLVVESMDQLRRLLQRREFTLTVTQHNLIRTFSPDDPLLFEAPRGERGRAASFELITPRPSRRDAEPPRIVVRGLSVHVELGWTRTPDQGLEPEVTVR